MNSASAAGAQPLTSVPLRAPARTSDARTQERRAQRRAEDVKLVQAALRGEEDAFRQIVERYQRQVYWIAYDVLLDGEEARDVAQETFIRVHNALERFDQSRDFVNWLYRIARNLAIDALRRRRRRAVPTEDLSHLPLSDESAGEGAELDLSSRVSRVLEELPVEYRLALTLRELHGMTPREIAAVTDCSYPTARWRLHRARSLFRQAWEKRYGTAVQGEDFS